MLVNPKVRAQKIAVPKKWGHRKNGSEKKNIFHHLISGQYHVISTIFLLLPHSSSYQFNIPNTHSLHARTNWQCHGVHRTTLCVHIYAYTHIHSPPYIPYTYHRTSFLSFLSTNFYHNIINIRIYIFFYLFDFVIFFILCEWCGISVDHILY